MPSPITFVPFRLEAEPARLWHGTREMALRPRSVAVLAYLAMHPERLVSKEELRQHVWEGAHLSDTVLRVCVQEIRAALGDRADAPTYLETLRGQGYRFLGGREARVALAQRTGLVVGRQREIEQLVAAFHRAAAGERQFVLLSGEPGIGKTTLFERFVARMAAQDGVRVVQSQCVMRYGEGEAYGPLLDALGRLGRGPQGNELMRVLRRSAPMWLVQLPGLVSEPELERLQHQVQGATRERMVRELCEALEVLTAETPLIVVLEDLHWADVSTLAFLGTLAQRPEPARLLLLGAYRPADAVLHAPVLREVTQELRGRGRCDELVLELLGEADVSAYLAGRLGGGVAETLVRLVFERSGGNPLFMVNLLEHLVRQDVLRQVDGQWGVSDETDLALTQVPEGLQPLILHRVEALPEVDRQVLEVASVAGVSFTTAAVAAGLEQTLAEVETHCESMAKQGDFLEAIVVSEWFDGTLSGRYRFRHALYQQVLYEQIGALRRVHLHRRMAARLEAGYGPQVHQIAAALAFHCEQGRDLPHAVCYRELCGTQALGRHAYREAIEHLTRALEGLERIPDTPQRRHQELDLIMALGPALIATQGYAAPEVEQLYARAQARLEGALRLAPEGSRHKVAEAESCFRQAIEVAREQQATSLELRAATSLAHLWQQQGKRQDAYDLLAPVYEWFTEGFDTADLQEAKALLEELT
jgi:predicted ATPase